VAKNRKPVLLWTALWTASQTLACFIEGQPLSLEKGEWTPDMGPKLKGALLRLAELISSGHVSMYRLTQSGRVKRAPAGLLLLHNVVVGEYGELRSLDPRKPYTGPEYSFRFDPNEIKQALPRPEEPGDRPAATTVCLFGTYDAIHVTGPDGKATLVPGLPVIGFLLPPAAAPATSVTDSDAILAPAATPTAAAPPALVVDPRRNIRFDADEDRRMQPPAPSAAVDRTTPGPHIEPPSADQTECAPGPQPEPLAGRAMRTSQRGRKTGQSTAMRDMCKMADKILNGRRCPKRRHGRTVAIAGMIAKHRKFKDYAPDTIAKYISSTVAAWETKHPGS
jgi:hypothetical protein